MNLCVYRDPVSEWPESQCSLARALYILDLSTNTAVNQTGNAMCGKKRESAQREEKNKRARGRRATDLFRGVGAEHDGVFRADDHFVLDAHSDAVKVFGELRIDRDVDTFLTWRPQVSVSMVTGRESTGR